MRKNNAKVILWVFLSLAVGMFFVFDLKQYFSLDYLKSQQDGFRIFYGTHPFLTGALFFLLYIGVTTFSLPGAAILTVASGALFGLFLGTLIASFASALGATLAFLTSRFVLQDYVQKRFGNKLTVVLEGFKKEGEFYLFTLRLIPFLPFFMVNLVMGLTSIRVSSFYLISQLGMLPATLVFVNAGTQIGQIKSLQGIVSPRLLLSFVLLGFFPLAIRKIVIHIKKIKAR